MSIFNLFKDTHVLITGHTGFKGSWLSAWLTQLGAKVIGLADYRIAFEKKPLFCTRVHPAQGQLLFNDIAKNKKIFSTT